MKRWTRRWAVTTILILLFTSLNVTAFADEGPGEDSEDWEFGAFGSNTSEDSNPPPSFNEDGSVTIEASGGKIASSEEGLSYYYTKLPADSNFEIETTAYADSYSPDSQRSFGLMLRNGVGENGDSGKQASEYVAVGALDDAMRGFYSQGGLSKLDVFSDNTAPGPGETYDLSIKKSGDTFVVTSNGQSETVTLDEAFSEDLYLGLYVARNGTVTFSDTNVEQSAEVSDLEVNAENMKTVYLIDEPLDLDGLEVQAVQEDGSRETLTEEDYIVTGFDSSEPGTNTITVSYNGIEKNIDLTITELQLTDMYINYYPAKTDYYVDDHFDPEGLEVIGEYEDGYQEEVLTSDQYTFFIDGDEIEEGAQLTEPETKSVIIQSSQNSDVSASFDIEVKDEQVTALEVIQPPTKTQYFIGDELDLDGLSVEASYSDGTTERLTKDQLGVSGLDTSTKGDKEVTLSYKGEDTAFTVNVKEKESEGIKVTGYPKTTYDLEEEFDAEGLEISKVYDNGDEEPLDQADYELDSSEFNSSEEGVYPITVTPADDSIEPITFDVTVRDQGEVDWQTIQFGQSTGSDTNYITEEDDSVRIVAEPGAGKITGDHDGITYYYTEIDAEEDNFELSADIKVNEYAKSPNHDGQESFGIMARDAIGEEDNSSVFASNIAAVGGFSGGTQEKNGTQLFIRDGVESPDGAGSQGVQKTMLNDVKPETGNTYPEQDYRLTLSKTNSGYTGRLNDGDEEIFFEPDILNVQDSKIYVGFYTARLADIQVSNIDYSVTAQDTDPPKVEAPEEPVEPEFSIESRSKTSESEYDLLLDSNVDGVVSVKQENEEIVSNESVEQGELTSVPAELADNDETNFSITFLPDDTQNLTSYGKQVKNFTVSMKTFNEEGDIHVTPSASGDGDGTEDHPVDLDTAVEYVLPGQKIVLSDGDYVRDSKLEIAKYNDGAKDSMKYLEAEDGARPVIDFDKKSEGVVLSGDYWHVKGIDFARSAGNTKGFTVGGNDNIVEESRFYEHGDTGLQISRTDTDAPKEEWPSNNLILNSESFDNRDPSDNNADGFAAKLTSGENNVFLGCIAHHNIDDGWDLYTKAGTGAIGPVLIEDSIAYENGALTDGTVGDGDKNGFKLGGEGIHVPHILRDSIAFNNGADGVTSNSNPGVIAENTVSYNNAGRNLAFTTYSNIEEDFTVDKFISYQSDHSGEDQYPEEAVSDDNFFFDGSVSQNESGTKLTDENFVSLTPELPYERDEDGTIIKGDFLKFQVSANAEWKPPVIKKKEKGKKHNDLKGPKAKAYVSLQDGFALEDIDVETLRLNGELEPIAKQKKKQIDDFDKDGSNEYEVRFSRDQLASILEKGEQEVVLTGELNSGVPFKAVSVVTVK
ncbi:bacterial Ig-like domain-containing protein [Halobacillus andaensis]|uniref:bacterial Ig-like domain-containing protein n=1 Tax=Halobacillus andaensis TaxID=1176239 RepID=UPI003D71DF20